MQNTKLASDGHPAKILKQGERAKCQTIAIMGVEKLSWLALIA